MFKQFRPLKSNEFFVVGCDTSAGLSDYCTAQFLSKTYLDVPLVYQSPVIATEMTNIIFPVLVKINKVTGVQPVIAYERANGGLFEMDRLSSLNRNNDFTIFQMPVYGQIDPSDPTKLGWDTNTASRPKMLSDLKEAIDKRLIKIYDQTTIDELFSFIIAKTTMSEKAQAEVGAHDDNVMALAIAWQLYQICKQPETNQLNFQVQQILNQRRNEEIY